MQIAQRVSPSAGGRLPQGQTPAAMRSAFRCRPFKASAAMQSGQRVRFFCSTWGCLSAPSWASSGIPHPMHWPAASRVVRVALVPTEGQAAMMATHRGPNRERRLLAGSFPHFGQRLRLRRSLRAALWAFPNFFAQPVQRAFGRRSFGLRQSTQRPSALAAASRAGRPMS